MRVATYTQPNTTTSGSLAAISLLVVVILLGTRVISSLLESFAPFLLPQLTFVWVLTYLLAFAGLMFTQGVNWISWLVRYRLLLVILLVGAIVSVSWSIDSRLSAERTVHLFGASLIAIYIGFTIPLLTTLRVFAAVLAVIVLGSFAAALLLPETGITDYEGTLVWRGLFNSKNDLGFWSGIGLLLYITLIDSSRGVLARLGCLVMASLCLVLLGFSQSATSLLVTILAGSLSLYLFIANRFELGFVRMCVMAVLFATMVGFAFTNIDTFELVGRNDDLTGRGEVWRQTWNLIMERPAGGYGYGALWFPTDSTIWIQQRLTDFSWVVFHAHNGFLQVASEIGLPLSVVALLMVAQQLVEIFYCQYERQQVGVLFVLAFVVAFLASNFSEARFLVTRELYWIFFLSLPISMLRQVSVHAEPTDHPDEYDAPGRGASSVPNSVFGVAAQVPSHWESDVTDEIEAMLSTLSMTETDIDLGHSADLTAEVGEHIGELPHLPSDATVPGGDVEGTESQTSAGTGAPVASTHKWTHNSDAPPFTVDKSAAQSEADRLLETELDEGADGTTRR